jgi:hypothetical protein
MCRAGRPLKALIPVKLEALKASTVRSVPRRRPADAGSSVSLCSPRGSGFRRPGYRGRADTRSGRLYRVPSTLNLHLVR